MGSLDLATQQLVVIARAFAKRARLLILDEPTAALTEGETQRLFEHLRDLRARGVAVIFVSHRLTEVFAIADRILVMRDGRVHGDHAVRDTTREQVVTRWSGIGSAASAGAPPQPGSPWSSRSRDLDVHDPDEPDATARGGRLADAAGRRGRGALRARRCRVRGARARRCSVRGPGRVEGSVRLRRRRRSAPRALARRVRAGHRHDVPGPPRDADARTRRWPTTSCWPAWPPCRPRGILDVPAQAGRRGATRRRALSIRARSTDQRVGSLSGGNQQKVQVARWLDRRTRGCCCWTIRRAAWTWAREPKIHAPAAARWPRRAAPSCWCRRTPRSCWRCATGSWSCAAAGHRGGAAPRPTPTEATPAERGGRRCERPCGPQRPRSGGRPPMADSIGRPASADRSRSATTPCCWSWSSPGSCSRSLTNGIFLSQRNLTLLALQTTITALAAISAVMLIVTRNFDLSVGSAVALVGVVVAWLTVAWTSIRSSRCRVAIVVGRRAGRVERLVGDAHRRALVHRDAGGPAHLPGHLADHHQQRHDLAGPASR